MDTEYVVDASALAKLFLDEDGAPAFRDWWYATMASGAAMMAPSLVRFEVGNLIRRNLHHLDAAGRRRCWRETLAGVQFDDSALAGSFGFPQLTFYDAAYLSLAAARKARLLTFDSRMAKAAAAQNLVTERPGA